MPSSPDDNPQTVFVGPINHLIVSSSSAMIEMDDVNGVRETLILWNDTDALLPDRVTQSMWISICRDSLAHGNSILALLENQNSAQISVLWMYAAASTAG
jgi:hypothetical protein